MLADKTIVLGVTGGIAVYKAADLASKLTQAGAKVKVIMTRHALEFVTPLTFEALTGAAVVTDMFETSAEHRINHVSLAETANIIVVTPATANVIAKLANGIADDMLTTTILATGAPVLIVPAMHTNMWVNPITQENVAKLKDRHMFIVEPVTGRLASGGYGAGRLPDTDTIMGYISQALGNQGGLAGKRIVVTAGGTQEPIDPVRVITNRSSGKMGYAISEAARDRGANVVLISAPVSLSQPTGIEMVPVETTEQMKIAVDKAVAGADVLIMAAAPADFRVKDIADHKIKKEKGNLHLELVNTPDILAEVKGNFIKVGFAAESHDLITNARLKIKNKHLDLIVANNILEAASGFGADTNKVILIGKDGALEDLPLMSKRAVADRILDRVVNLLVEKSS
jgi:phosphopantothenoylcysteine decarboxylase / phosphopantothenate---cysteine ligase